MALLYEIWLASLPPASEFRFPKSGLRVPGFGKMRTNSETRVAKRCGQGGTSGQWYKSCSNYSGESRRWKMQSLIPLFFIAFPVYLIFFRKGGMGCCAGHANHKGDRQQKIDSESPSYKTEANVIDLEKDEYKIQG